MSLERTMHRAYQRKRLKEQGVPTKCKKCRSEMFNKPGYGWVCTECGWECAKCEFAPNNTKGK